MVHDFFGDQILCLRCCVLLTNLIVCWCVLWNFLLSGESMRGDTRIRGSPRLQTFPTALPVLWSIDILQGGAVPWQFVKGVQYIQEMICRGGGGGPGLLLGMLWVHVQLHVSTWTGAWWTAEAQMYREWKGISTRSGLKSHYNLGLLVLCRDENPKIVLRFVRLLL